MCMHLEKKNCDPVGFGRIITKIPFTFRVRCINAKHSAVITKVTFAFVDGFKVGALLPVIVKKK